LVVMTSKGRPRTITLTFVGLFRVSPSNVALRCCGLSLVHFRVTSQSRQASSRPQLNLFANHLSADVLRCQTSHSNLILSFSLLTPMSFKGVHHWQQSPSRPLLSGVARTASRIVHV
jgi:hypothetical protein